MQVSTIRSARKIKSRRQSLLQLMTGLCLHRSRGDKTSGSGQLLSFSRRHLVKLVGLPGPLPGSFRGSLTGSLADVVEETPRVFNCFFHARGVEQGVAAEDLFSLGERAVGDRDLAVGSFVHADACGAKAH